MRGVWIVFLKEMRETLRDRRTLLMMIVVPVLLYPILLIVAEQLALFGMRQLEAEASRVAVAGAPDPELREFLRTRDELEIVEVGDPEEALRRDSVTAVAVVGAGDPAEGSRSVRLVYDAADDRSQQGRDRLRDALRGWSDTLLARRIVRRGLPAGFARPLEVADSSVARPEELGGYALGRFLPMLLVIITLLGAFYPAIDLAAGEKERGTLETLLTAPVPPGQVVTGKFITVATIGVVAAALNLASMLLTFQTGLFQLGGALEIEFSLRPAAVGLIFLTLIPLAVLFGALFLGIAVRSRSFKEAQNALTPVYMLVMIPALLPLFPGIEFTPVLALVPVAGVALFFRELMGGSAPLVPGLLAIASTVGYATAALLFAADSFGRENVLFGSDEPTREEGEGEPVPGWRGWLRPRSSAETRGGVPTPRQALGLVAMVGLFFFYLGIRFQVSWGERGLLLTEWVLLFLPAVLFVTAGGYDVRRTFSLRRPSGRQLGAALLIIVGGTPLAWFLAWLQSFVLPIPDELVRGMTEMFSADSLPRFLWLLFLLAVTPAICEEAVFRGVLLGGTRERMSPFRFVLLNALVFGAFHLSFETAFRFVPTAWLGLLLAWTVWRTGSIWTGTLMHFVNNASVVVLLAFPTLMERFSDPEAPPPLFLLPVAFLALGAGWALLRESPPEEWVPPPTGGGPGSGSAVESGERAPPPARRGEETGRGPGPGWELP